MKNFNKTTSYKEFQVMLQEEVTLEILGKKEPKYTLLLNIKS
jgi:hypothetical protein